MKKVIYLIIGMISSFAIMAIIPHITNTIADASNDNKEIVGSWVSTAYSNMFQFKEDGTGVYFCRGYTYIDTAFTYSYDKANNEITINSTYKTSKNGEEIVLKDKKCYISICGDGMIFLNPFSSGSQVSNSYAFTRA